MSLCACCKGTDLKAGHPGVPSYICLFVWAMVGWVTLPLFSFCFLKTGVLCTCISMHAHVHAVVMCGGWCAIIRVYGVCRHV